MIHGHRAQRRFTVTRCGLAVILALTTSRSGFAQYRASSESTGLIVPELIKIVDLLRGDGEREYVKTGKRAKSSRDMEDLVGSLKRKKILAVHKRKNEYPNARDFAGVDLAFVPIRAALRASYPLLTLFAVPAQIEKLAKDAAQEYGLDVYLILGVIKVESDFNPAAVSVAGARGLMQLMPETALDMGVTDVFDPAQNIAAGSQYLAKLSQMFNNDPRLTLAAYHAGPGAVKKYNGVPPYKGVEEYIQRVQGHAARFAEEGVKDIVTAQILAPQPSSLPQTPQKHYIIQFENGLTQRAEVIVSADEYYLVTYEGRTDRISKDHVARIVEAA